MNIIQSLKLASGIGRKWLVKNAPDVLIGVSIGMSTAAVILTIPATVRAEKLILQKQEEAKLLAEAKNEDPHDFTKLEKVKACWICYIPTLLTLGTSVTTAIFANRLSAARIAALATAYSLSEKKFREYEEKVTEMIGVDKEKKVRDSIAQEFVERNPATEIVSGGGEYLCCDMMTGRYFRSTQEKVRRAFNSINHRLLTEGELTLNELYDEFDLPHVEIGDKLGWRMYDSSDLIEPVFSTVQYPATGEPCLAVDYDVGSIYDFRSL